uniref:ZP domain-containing protein n=1 Tax=Syphacia muris TaxID=451379 RepID=A0A0N5AWL1_9BILA
MLLAKFFTMIQILTFISAIYINVLYAISLDNGIVAEPEIECGAVSLGISFSTKHVFDGHVYVKGRYDEPGCRSDEGGEAVAGITLPFNSCGVSRIRSLNPRGVYVSTTVIITFHPQFLTKIDKAYRIQCFYMEADKTVSTPLEVSEIATHFISHTVPMPSCHYDVLDGGPQGEVVTFASVGQQVYHKWTCDSEIQDIFCMIVHTCYVDDGQGKSVEILGDDGCAKDKYILNNLEYPTDLMAGQEAHIYKFADRSQLYFQCQISLSVKEPHQECPRPICNSLKRRKRHVNSIGTIDILSQNIETLDISVPPSVFDDRGSLEMNNSRSLTICFSSLSKYFYLL